MRRTSLFSLSLCWWPSACAAGPSESKASADASPSFIVDRGLPGSLDDQGIEMTAIGYRAFAKINGRSYPTRQHLGNPLVNVYANAAALATYSRLDYGTVPDANVSFPVGSMLVKEMLDDAGAPSVLTVMYKKGTGYAREDDDWWFGRLSTDGTPTSPGYAGQVPYCIACHAGAATSDYAWGVSTSDK